nr:VTT domain-containing protein [Chthonobacter albigriseus]
MLGVVPGSVLGAVTGALYGPVLGFAISAVALLTAASAAFLLSRTLLRPFAERLRERHAGMTDVTALLEAEGWRLVCLIRLSPVLPFAPTSYLLGLSRLSFRDYIVGTLASLPALFCYVLIGSVSAAGVENGSTAEMLKSGMIVVGLGASAVLTAHVVRRVARARQPALAPAE